MNLAPDALASIRLYIFDADGTLRWTTIPGAKYPTGHDQWRLMPNVAERLSSIPFGPNGPWLAIASNQNGVADGIITEQTAVTLMHTMITAALGSVPPGTTVAMCICSEQIECRCRKPAPGLLLDLLEAYGVAPSAALFVGDLSTDQEAAHRAGISFVWARDFFGWPL